MRTDIRPGNTGPGALCSLTNSVASLAATLQVNIFTLDPPPPPPPPPLLCLKGLAYVKVFTAHHWSI